MDPSWVTVPCFFIASGRRKVLKHPLFWTFEEDRFAPIFSGGSVGARRSVRKKSKTHRIYLDFTGFNGIY